HEGGGNYEQVDLLASAAEMRAAAALKPMPLFVLSAPAKPQPPTGAEGARIHDELQLALARLLPDSSQMLAEKSGHFIQLDQPELVTNAVRKVVEVARQKLAAR